MVPSPNDLIGEKIVFACFDWGMGHLMRSIPLILQLEKQGNELHFLGDELQIKCLLEYGFKGQLHLLNGSELSFSGSGNFVFEGLRNFFRGPKFIQRDKKAVKKWVKIVGATIVISDHRYGFWSKNVTSIFLTHQVKLPQGTPSLVQSMHANWVRNFQFVWVFDDAKEKIAGILSDCPANGRYIGFYSRFQLQQHALTAESGWVAIISGPEPYADQFFEQISELAFQNKQFIHVVCSERFHSKHAYLSCVYDSKDADRVIAGAALILSRNGYTTLMDLRELKKPALLLTTPGQTEQAYLAIHCKLPAVQMFTDFAAYEQAFKQLI